MTTLWYLATPYTHYAPGLKKAFRHAAQAAAGLLKQGINVYSPIAHSHPIAWYGGISPTDQKLWLAFDAAMMERCDGLIVIRMAGWNESAGIAHEIGEFLKQGKPIRHFGWPSLTELARVNGQVKAPNHEHFHSVRP